MRKFYQSSRDDNTKHINHFAGMYVYTLRTFWNKKVGLENNLRDFDETTLAYNFWIFIGELYQVNYLVNTRRAVCNNVLFKKRHKDNFGTSLLVYCLHCCLHTHDG